MQSTNWDFTNTAIATNQNFTNTIHPLCQSIDCKYNLLAKLEVNGKPVREGICWSRTYIITYART